MGLIIKNGIEYVGGNVATAETVQYDNKESQLVATNVQDALDELAAAGGGSGNASERVLTQAEYDALSDEKYTDNITYYITDSEELSADNVAFDGTAASLEATTVQGAIIELNNKIGTGGSETAPEYKDVILTLALDEWMLDEDTGDYTLIAAVEGLSETTNPIVLLKPAGEEATEDELESYSSIYDIKVNDGNIVFTADKLPSVEFAVVIKSAVESDGNEIADLEYRVQKLETSLKDVAIPLLLDNWVEEDGVYVQNITVDGLSGDIVPVIALSSVNEEASEEELYAYSCIADVVVTEGNIKFIASDMPGISFTVVAKGVTANENNVVADITALVGRVSELENELTLVEIEWTPTAQTLGSIDEIENCYAVKIGSQVYFAFQAYVTTQGSGWINFNLPATPKFNTNTIVVDLSGLSTGYGYLLANVNESPIKMTANNAQLRVMVSGSYFI